MRQALRRNPSRERVSVGAPLPAPTEGWDTSEALAGMSPKRAIQMDNFFPQAEWVEIRRGHVLHTDMDIAAPVESLLSYHGTTSSALFAAVGGAIYDVTDPLDIPEPELVDLGSDRWQGFNVANGGGSYLWICNGVDNPKFYDGTEWTDAEITGIDAAEIVQAELHKGRIWGVYNRSTIVTYASVIDAIQGAFSEYDLGALMSLGGYVQAVASWSRDGGDGPDDYIAFITSQGQVLVFSGLFPDDANSWGLVGVYNIAPPIGRRCVCKLGGDLLIVTIDGVVSMTLALGQDRAFSVRSALTQRIRRAMATSARRFGQHFGWDLLAYPRGTSLILNVPLEENVSAHQYVMNTMTGAWCRYTGQNANCWTVFNDRLFFGGNNGRVYEADASGLDATGPLTAELRTSFQTFSRDAAIKSFKMVHVMVNRDGLVNPTLGIDTDFRDETVLASFPSELGGISFWDEAYWDEAFWSNPVQAITNWVPVDGIGHNASIRMRVELSQAESDTIPVEVKFQINGFNIIMEKGGFF